MKFCAPRALGDAQTSLGSPLWRGIVFGALILTACAPKTRTMGPGDRAHNEDSELTLGERVELLTLEGQPRMQVIRRSGDPAGALGLALFPEGGSRDVLLLLALLEARLKDPGVSYEAHSLGLVLSREVTTKHEATKWFDSLHQILTTKVTRDEADALHPELYLKAARARVGAASPYLECLGILGAEGAATLSSSAALDPKQLQETLEEVRHKTVNVARVGLSVLGNADLIEGVTSAHNKSWPEGRVVDDSWAQGDSIASLESAGGRELRVALRLVDSEAALAAARALQKPEHPLHARLSALDPSFTTGQPQVSLRPAGACAGLTISLGEGPRPALEHVAEAASLVLEELTAASKAAITGEEEALTLLTPQGAREGAALGAWTAVHSPTTGAGTSSIIEYRSPPAEKVSESNLTQSLKNAKDAWRKQLVDVRSLKEDGQAELWMLLGSRCGTTPESEEDAGRRALTIHALAKNYSGLAGVTLDPWVTPLGIGLLAHSPARRGESAKVHSARVARSLGQAFSGPPVDGRVIAEVHSKQLDLIGSDPGGALMMTILGAGHPSLLDVRGLESSTETVSAADVENLRADLVEEPLTLAVLENAKTDQALVAQNALSQWLSPRRKHLTACPKVEPKPATPGTWTLETLEPSARPGAYIGVFHPGPVEYGRATAFLLNRPGGYLDTGLLKPGLAAHAEAEWLGGGEFGALLVHVGAEPHLLESAVHQVRAILHALSKGALTDADANLARAELVRREQQTERTARGRIVQLFQTAEGDPSEAARALDPARLRRFQAGFSEEQHRLLLVKQRN